MIRETFRLILLAGCVAWVSACNQSSSDGSASGTDEPTGGTDSNGALVLARMAAGPVKPGDNFDIEISLDNFPPTEGGGIDIRFDPALIQVVGVDLDPGWDFVGQTGVIDNASGEISDILYSAFSSPQGSLRVATVHARAVAPGSTAISLTGSKLNPFASGGKSLEVVFEAGSIEIN